jgi:hypothetical protein
MPSGNAAGHSEDALASCVAQFTEKSPDLARVVEAWPDLRGANRRAGAGRQREPLTLWTQDLPAHADDPTRGLVGRG